MLSGKRTGLRRALSMGLATINRWLDKVPLTHWLHRRIRSRLEMPDLTLPLRPDNEALSGLRIAFVSDVHAGSFLNEKDLTEIFRRVQEQQPDLVLFGGDMINTLDREILLFRGALTVLKPRYGMFAVPGNHDHFFGPDISLWRGFLEENGVQVLMNRGVRIQHGGQSLWMCGVDDLTEGEPDLDAKARRRSCSVTIRTSSVRLSTPASTCSCRGIRMVARSALLARRHCSTASSATSRVGSASRTVACM